MPFIHCFSLFSALVTSSVLEFLIFMNSLPPSLPPSLSLSLSLSLSPSPTPSFAFLLIYLSLHTHTPSVAALSAYQRYQQLSPLESSTNTSVTYGLGLIYFNMNSYKW